MILARAVPPFAARGSLG